ncbi:NAD(P)H-binding protein [Gracilimonas sp.]|uniref:NAD(P)H-binding protein n=1 Tax=Gracilimonas sp. TaxID=1974203 RepID=UPI003D0D6262
MNKETVLVTGATGNVGREVVAALQSFHPEADIRVAVRSPKELDQKTSDYESVYLDFQDPDSFTKTVAGCTSVFLLRPPAISNTKDTLNRFIGCARKSGVRRIVFLSVAGAADNRWVPHHAVEQELKNGPLDWVILRPGFFAQNLESAYREDIVQDDRLYVPAGNGRVAFVDVRDIGEVAAKVLTSPNKHAGMIYTLTGPESYTFYEVADLLSQYLNRSIIYKPASIPGYMFHLLFTKNMGFMQSIVQTILHVGLRFGQAEKVDPTLGRLLSHAPNNIEHYIRDHTEVWEE